MEANKLTLIHSEHPLSELKGVGPKSIGYLNELGIYSIEDMLLKLPYAYDDETAVDIHTVADGEKVTLIGEIYTPPSITHFGRKKSKLSFHMMVNEVAVRVEFFNQLYIKQHIEIGAQVKVTGKFNLKKQILSGSKFQKVSVDLDVNQPIFQPKYSLKGLIKNATYKKMVHDALNKAIVNPLLPVELKEKYKLWDLNQCLTILHQPTNSSDLKQARRSFAFIELFLFQLKMRYLHKKEHGVQILSKINYHIDEVKQFIQTLPFELTDAQKQVVNEIFRDMHSDMRMNRLLQGDVGSGKTVVAAICMFALKTCGLQSALMVPTEILAEQHASSLSELFGDRANIALLTSSVKGKKRTLILEQLVQGEIDILVGTHALISDPIVFKDLRLVITDEQHRFGVNQRKLLREKGPNSNVLFMTATPIPRTLAISVFGEMDVSMIKQMPKGRKPIITSWAKHQEIESIIEMAKVEISKGRQMYVICPLIEASEKLDVQNAVEIYEFYQQRFGQEKVGLLHGKMKPAEKDAVMMQFANHELDILVSTTVVEVGVNVPNATLMAIYDADRFGLSTLHQLRGRVGRSEHQSYCVLISNPESETGIERMNIMTSTTDGFVLSEKDLEMRGPGDFFGVKQSGLPDFKVANIVEDYRMLEVARDEASSLILNGAIDLEENKLLKQHILNDIAAYQTN